MKRFFAVTAWMLTGLLASTAHANADWQMAIEVERIHQSFGDGDSDIETVTFAPAAQLQDWSLSATLSWQHVDGSYFVNNLYPNLEYVCSQINGLTPAQKLFLVRRGTLTAQQIQYCNQTSGVESNTVQDSTEGFNDIELFANYYLPFLHDNVSGAVGVGYKHDNGDVNVGLGTGTRDVFAETSWWWNLDELGLLLTLGYEHLLSNTTDIDLNDYGYATVDAHWQPYEIARLGVEYHFQQANADVLNDFDYLTYYLRFGRAAGWGARLFITDYQNKTGYPDDEFGGSLSYVF